MNRRAVALLLGVLAGTAAQAADPVPDFLRYLPLYPGLYGTAGYEQDARDSVFDQSGNNVGTAAPNAGGSGRTKFPERRYSADFVWFFPMWEGEDVPFFSNRLHTARARLNVVDTKAEGRLAQFAADPSDDSYTEADKLENNGSGVGDLEVEFGSVLYGSPDWRKDERSTLSMTALFGLTLPYGNHDRDAPVSSGDNRAAIHLTLGGNWQPWTGGFLDAGITRREFFQNYDGAFGRLTPTEQGDETTWDLSLAQRVFSGAYVSVFADHRQGAANGYEDPAFAPNAPPPDGDSTSNQPTPGYYEDGGTALTRIGASLHYFIGQNWLAGLYYARPRSGESGEFDLPYENHNPAGCVEGATGCTVTPRDSVRVDGLGSARSYASDSVQLTLTYMFGLGDTFTCRGCKEGP